MRGLGQFEIVGERLRRPRAERGLTLRDVAKATGISAGTLSRLERGMDSHGSIVATLAAYYGVTLDSLYQWREDAEGW